jgi:hypothetical protein
MNKINGIRYSSIPILCFKKQFVALHQIIHVRVAQPRPNTIHSLTPWSRALLEKPNCSQLFKKFPPFYGTRRFNSAFTSALHLSRLYFFCNLLHHSRHASNRWVHHQGLIYISIRFVRLSLWYTATVSHFTLFLKDLCVRQASMNVCQTKNYKQKDSNISKPMTMNQKIRIISRTVSGC